MKFLSRDTLKLFLKPGGVWLLLGVAHHVHRSSNQGEADGFYSVFENQFDTLKSSTEWTGLEVQKAGFWNMLRTAVMCCTTVVPTVTKAEVTAAVSGHFTPEAGCKRA